MWDYLTHRMLEALERGIFETWYLHKMAQNNVFWRFMGVWSKCVGSLQANSHIIEWHRSRGGNIPTTSHRHIIAAEACWSIGKERNKCIFRFISHTLNACFGLILYDINLWTCLLPPDDDQRRTEGAMRSSGQTCWIAQPMVEDAVETTAASTDPNYSR